MQVLYPVTVKTAHLTKQPLMQWCRCSATRVCLKTIMLIFNYRHAVALGNLEAGLRVGKKQLQFPLCLIMYRVFRFYLAKLSFKAESFGLVPLKQENRKL